MNYFLSSQRSEQPYPTQQINFSQTCTQTSSQPFSQSIRPSLLMARSQLEQRQKEKEMRKNKKKEMMRALMTRTTNLCEKLEKKKERLQKLRDKQAKLAEEVLFSFNEQSAMLVNLFDSKMTGSWCRIEKFPRGTNALRQNK
ncbi:hypothetical protein EIN_372300 [Entamoeba invadens IP1]|uniref:Uncharacterized protein n=1 Tax=Entamoeba invadens IP1 TaxID=370355 RepID=A0A0A1UCD3_ENTIV|nr:hypothetical protein EIN_372300 [Entamoeba invadens IP1]ELP92808.1 hypothetical protein EIN_372300 [Entamoeba invadens IP1]|eukprot:XP_004259579.1 hypothetical protein EIN_372300 [Entamoeba invadens IP1]